MKILVTCPPAHDHLLGLLPIAEAAKREGHDVAIAVLENFREVVTGAGLKHFDAGEDWIPEAIDDRVDDVLPETMAEFTQDFMAQMLCGPAAISMAKDVKAIIDSWQPDIVMRDSGEMGGLLAAEMADLPHISIGVLDFNGMFLGDRIVAALNERRAELGLPDDAEGYRQYEYGHINMMCPTFAPEELTLPNTFSVRVDGVGRGDALPDWIANIANAEKPLIYASFGTAAATIPGFGPALRNVVDGLGLIDANAIVSVGKSLNWNGEQVIDEHDIPKNVYVVDWAPQALLMRNIDLLVTHGGPSTTRQGIVCGVPIVAVPLLFDGFEIANRLCEKGLAVQLDWTKLSASEVTDAVKHVLADPKYRRQARKLQREALAVPPIDNDVVRFIESVESKAKR